MTLALTLPRWHDLHAHMRQGANLPVYVRAHAAMGCAGFLAIPNTRPPVAHVTGADTESSLAIETYLRTLRDAAPEMIETIIVPLYLTGETTPEMIESGAAAGLLTCAKYYPPHGTTNADFGRPLAAYAENGVLAAMEAAGVILNVHGEAHGLSGPGYFDAADNAENRFYSETLPDIAARFPDLKIVCEHVTTARAAAFVAQSGPRIAATITPQHLLYTAGHLLQGLRYHLYCLPLVKFEADRAALREAALRPGQTQFFAGTDSAPHTHKCTDVGCAAGCFTGGIAPQLYAMAFEEAGADLSAPEGAAAFRAFLCDNGPAFYGLTPSSAHFTLEKADAPLAPLEVPEGPAVLPLPLGMGRDALPWRIA